MTEKEIINSEQNIQKLIDYIKQHPEFLEGKEEQTLEIPIDILE